MAASSFLHRLADDISYADGGDRYARPSAQRAGRTDPLTATMSTVRAPRRRLRLGRRARG